MKAKKLIVAILAIVSMCCFFVGCLGNETPPQTAIVYVFNDDNKGVVSGVENEQEVTIGEEVSVSIVAKDGFLIKTVQWGDEEIVVNAMQTSFEREVFDDVEMFVSYEESTCVLTIVNDNTKGVVSGVTNGQEVTIGEEVSVSIVAKDGFLIQSVSWAGEAIVITQNKSVAFTREVVGDVELCVSYEKASCVLTIVNDNAKGVVSGVTNGQEIDAGSEISVTISPKEHYKISSVTLGGTSVAVTNENGFSFVSTVNASASLVVVYSPVLYSVSVQTSVEGDGDVSTEGTNSLGQITGVENGGLYEYGTVVTVVVTPKVAYGVTIVSITVNGQSVQVNPQGTTFNITIEEVNQIIINYVWSEGWTPNA